MQIFHPNVHFLEKYAGESVTLEVMGVEYTVTVDKN